MIHAIRNDIVGLCAATTILLASTANAQTGTLFGVSNVGGLSGQGSSTLLEIDPSTGAGTATGVIATANEAFFSGLAFDASTRTLFGAGASGRLASIDLATGTPTTIGSTGEGGILDLAFDDASGTLFALVNGNTGVDDELVTIDTSTGAVTSLGQTGLNLAAISFGPGGELFAIETDGADELVTIDPMTLISSTVGQLGTSVFDTQSVGLAYDEGSNTLFSHNFSRGVPNQLLAIDADTGAASVVGSIGFFGIGALAFVPVPEPGSGFLLGLASVACLNYRRRG